MSEFTFDMIATHL